MSKEDIKEIIELYKQGKNLTEIAKKFGICSTTVKNTLIKNKIKVFSFSKDRNNDYFKTIDSEDKAYFLGFLLADGCISKKNNSLSFTINSNDDYILETFKKKLNAKNKIKRRKVYDARTNKYYDATGFQVSSPEIKKDLENLGITYNKSETFDFSLIVKNPYFNHFLRGLFDGDGYVSNNEKKTDVVMLISTKEFLCFLQTKYFTKETKLVQVAKNKNIYRLYLYGRNTCVDFLDWLYKDATIFLKRKYEKFLKIKNSEATMNTRFVTYTKIINLETKEENYFTSLKKAAEYYNLCYSYLTTVLKKTDNYKNLKFIRTKGKQQFLKKDESKFKHVNNIV